MFDSLAFDRVQIRHILSPTELLAGSKSLSLTGAKKKNIGQILFKSKKISLKMYLYQKLGCARN